MARTEKHLFADGSRYISAGDAAALYGFTRDYIGKLCREGSVKAKRVGSRWFVSEGSLVSFVLDRQSEHKERRTKLAHQRLKEYRAHAQRVPAAQKAPETGSESIIPMLPGIRSFVRVPQAPAAAVFVPDNREIGGFVSQIAHLPTGIADVLAQQAVHMPVHTLAPVADVLHRATALFGTLLAIGVAYTLVDPESARIAMTGLWAHAAQLAAPAVLIGLW
jgi:hypothetical protein